MEIPIKLSIFFELIEIFQIFQDQIILILKVLVQLGKHFSKTTNI